MTKARDRRGLFSKLFDLLTSPTAAFALSFPTIGFYSLSVFSSLLGETGGLISIGIRVFAVLVLLVCTIRIWKHKTKLVLHAFPGLLFFIIYSLRVTENVAFLGIAIEPDTTAALLMFTIGCVAPSVILPMFWNSFPDKEMRIVMSVLCAIFLVGMALNSANLEDVGEARLALERVNPISLAYTSSSFAIFFIISSMRGTAGRIEAVIFIPPLMAVAALARSRGMIISTMLCIVLFLLLQRGGRRIIAMVLVAVIGAVMALVVNPEYIENAISSVQNIDTTTDLSTAARVVAFRGAYEQFVADPFFGRYIVERITNYYPHNIYLESLMSVGLFGTIPFVFHLYFATRAAFGILREPAQTIVRPLVALFFIREAIGSAASGSLWGSAGFWIASFLTIAMWYGRKQQEHRSSRRRLRAQPLPAAFAGEGGRRLAAHGSA